THLITNKYFGADLKEFYVTPFRSMALELLAEKEERILKTALKNYFRREPSVRDMERVKRIFKPCYRDLYFLYVDDIEIGSVRWNGAGPYASMIFTPSKSQVINV